jgi:arginine exporter protein ArgO
MFQYVLTSDLWEFKYKLDVILVTWLNPHVYSINIIVPIRLQTSRFLHQPGVWNISTKSAVITIKIHHRFSQAMKRKTSGNP